MLDPAERVPAIVAPELGVRRAVVRVKLAGGSEDRRQVQVGEGADGWALWARETRFALDNTRFIDIGEAVYRCETIERIEPITDATPDPTEEALQACLATLTMIRDALLPSGSDDPRQLCALMLHTLEQRGFVLREVPPPTTPE